MKLKLGGGRAGNNGLKSIKAHLHTDDVARVRIGIGKPPGRTEGANHVLKRPGKADRAELDLAVGEAADAVEAILADGQERAINEFNSRPAGTTADRPSMVLGDMGIMRVARWVLAQTRPRYI